MERVVGIGGVFFKARDPKALAAWYREHLGVPVEPDVQDCRIRLSGPIPHDRARSERRSIDFARFTEPYSSYSLRSGGPGWPALR